MWRDCNADPCFFVRSPSKAMKVSVNTTDYLRRFLFREVSVRAQRVRLEETLAETFGRRSYPEPVADELAKALAATALLAATVKFEGRLTLQVRGQGLMPLLVTQALPDGGLRGLARVAERASMLDAQTSPAALYGKAELVIAIAAERDGVPYQGIVPISEAGLEASIENYFVQSEQIPTRILLRAAPGEAHGLLLQGMPSGDAETAQADFRTLAAALDARAQSDLIHLGDEMLVKRLFPEYDLELFAPQPVQFRCHCSRPRTAQMVHALGAEETGRILEEEGAIDVDCEFCGARYRFDRLDVAQLFSGTPFTNHEGNA